MSKINIQKLINDYSMGYLDFSSIPGIAIKLIEDGVENESLYILAGLKEDEWEDIKRYFEQAISEFGFKIIEDKWEIIIPGIIHEIANNITIEKSNYVNYLDLNPIKLFSVINDILLIDSSKKIMSYLATGAFEQFAIYGHNSKKSRVKKFEKTLKEYSLRNKKFKTFLETVINITYVSENDKEILKNITSY